jgi:hypothetical protein
MKLRNLIEIEYGVHDLLTQHTDQIKSDSGPNTYRMLQTQLALGKDAWVKDWLIKNSYEKENPTPLKEALKKDGHLYNVEEVGEISAMGLGSIPMDVAYVGDDGMLGDNSTFISWRDVKRLTNKYSSSDDKSTSFHELDAKHEDEEYCPKCASKIKEIIKKEIAECWKTHKQVGTKKKGGKTVPNCVPKNEEVKETSNIDPNNRPEFNQDEDNAYRYFNDLRDDGNFGNPNELLKDLVDFLNIEPKEAKRILTQYLKDLETEQLDVSVDEAKTKPAKGKRFAKKIKDPQTGRTRTVSYGQAGKAKKGGDRIRPGTAKGNAYCARSAKIKKCKNPPCANTLSRRKWKCQGSRSVA